MNIVVSRSLVAANGFTIHESASAPLPECFSPILDEADFEEAATRAALFADALFMVLPSLQRRDEPPRETFANAAS